MSNRGAALDKDGTGFFVAGRVVKYICPVSIGDALRRVAAKAQYCSLGLESKLSYERPTNVAQAPRIGPIWYISPPQIRRENGLVCRGGGCIRLDTW